MLDFKPPKPNTTAIRVAKALMPLISRLYLNGLTLAVDTESITRLKTTDGHPTVFGSEPRGTRGPSGYVSLVQTALSAVLLHDRA